MAGRRRKLKYGKIAIVVFLTVLIWVWADITLDEVSPPRRAVIVVDESAGQKLWVSFAQKSSMEVELTLSGPHSALLALDRKLRKEGNDLQFAFNAVREKITEPPGRSVNVLQFLQSDQALRDLGLKVKSVEPEIVDVNVVALEPKTLPVECFKEDGSSLKAESIVPSDVEMYVPGDTRTAQIRLSQDEIQKARADAILKTPYIILAEAEGLIRYAKTPVRIKMPPPTDPLNPETINQPRLGIVMSVNLQGKYDVRILNETEVTNPLKIRATAAAKQAYEGMRFQMILEIDDEDIRQDAPQREVKYNFPEEFVRSRQIEINQPPVPVRFEIKQISPAPDTP